MRLIDHDPRIIDLETAEVRHNGSPIVSLSGIEVALLRYLAAKRGQPVGRPELFRHVWGHTGTSGRAVDHVVKRLRRKIEPDPGHPTLLLTVRGVGYRLRIPAVRRPGHLIGREADWRLLLPDGRPRSTAVICGAAGIGKTHLAEAVSDAAHGRVVEVHGADLPGVVRRVAVALGVELPAEGIERSLGRVYRAARSIGLPLLVLDGTDQLDDAALQILLDPPEGLSVWVTRRVRPRLRDAVHVLRGLDPDHAVELLIARGAPPSDALQAIAQHLDGHPLALVLAAARLAVVPPAAILADVRIDAWDGGRLGAALRSHWGSLSHRRQIQLAILALVQAPVPLADLDGWIDDPDPTGAVVDLEGASWVVVRDGAVRVPTPMRSFVVGADAEVTAQAQLQRWSYLGGEARRRGALAFRGDPAAKRWLTTHTADLIEACHSPVDPDPAAAAALALDLVPRTPQIDAAIWATLDRPDLSSEDRALLLNLRAKEAASAGRHPEADRDWQDALAATSDPAIRARCLTSMGLAASKAGHHARALDLLRQAQRTAEAQPDPLWRGVATSALATAQAGLGAYDEAEALHLRAIRLARRADNLTGEAMGWNNVGVQQANRGQLGAARSAFLRAWALADRHEIHWVAALTQSNVAVSDILLEDWASCRDAARIALDHAQRIRDLDLEAWILSVLAMAELLTGGPPDLAEAQLKEVLALQPVEWQHTITGTCLLAPLVALRGDPSAAEDCLARAEAMAGDAPPAGIVEILDLARASVAVGVGPTRRDPRRPPGPRGSPHGPRPAPGPDRGAVDRAPRPPRRPLSPAPDVVRCARSRRRRAARPTPGPIPTPRRWPPRSRRHRSCAAPCRRPAPAPARGSGSGEPRSSRTGGPRRRTRRVRTIPAERRRSRRPRPPEPPRRSRGRARGGTARTEIGSRPSRRPLGSR